MRHRPPHVLGDLHMDVPFHMCHWGSKDLGMHFRLGSESGKHDNLELLCARRCHFCPCHGAGEEAWSSPMMGEVRYNKLRREMLYWVWNLHLQRGKREQK